MKIRKIVFIDSALIKSTQFLNTALPICTATSTRKTNRKEILLEKLSGKTVNSELGKFENDWVKNFWQGYKVSGQRGVQVALIIKKKISSVRALENTIPATRQPKNRLLVSQDSLDCIGYREKIRETQASSQQWFVLYKGARS